MWQNTVLIAAVCAVAGVCGRVDIATSDACTNVPTGTLIRSPTSCAHYLYCSEGEVAFESTCADGLVFNRDIQACGLGDSHSCYFDHISTSGEGKPEQSAAAKVCEGVEERTFVASPTSCKHYYLCHDGIAEEGKCPIGHYFDAVEQFCGYSSNTQCKDVENVFETHAEVQQAVPRLEDVVCKNVVDDTFVPSPTSCSHYFLCSKDIAREDKCPEGYAFNEEEQVCDPEDSVQCLQCPKSGKFDFADPKNCNYFYRCDNGERSLYACGTKDRFDQKTGTCKPRKEVTCDVSDICHYRNETTNNFIIGDLNDCKKFHFCKNNTSPSTMSECSGNLLFNPKSSMCEMKHFVEDCVDNVPRLASETFIENQDIEKNRRNARRIRPPRRDERHPDAETIRPTRAPDTHNPEWDFPGQPPRQPNNFWGPPQVSGSGGNFFPSNPRPETTTARPRPPGGLPIFAPKPTQRPRPEPGAPVTWGPPRVNGGGGGGSNSFSGGASKDDNLGNGDFEADFGAFFPDFV